MKRIIVSLVTVLISSASMWAVVASPEPIEVTQGDGTKVTLRIVGDEFHHYYTLLDGTPVRRNTEGIYVSDPSVIETPLAAKKARRVMEQTQISGSFPLEGSPKSVVILVNFKDLKFQYKLEDFQQMLNESGYSKNGGIGSARDYFIASSDSVFSPVFDCYGPVTLSQNYAYYGANVGNSASAHAADMVIEACNLVANDLGVDMTQYDTNNDGRLDNVFIYFAGHNEAEHGGENTIWPHRSVVGGNERVQGKLIYDYACTSELRGASGNSMCGIGTFCHEFGHVLGLPDYYDTGYHYYTVGEWDIMCNGSYNGNGKTPPTYTAGERFQLGWLKPVQLKDAGLYTLKPLETGNSAYLIAKSEHNLSFNSASPNEYWLLENRQRVGWDAASTVLPGTGMLVFHITYSSSAWNNNTPNNSEPLRYDIEEAGGVKGFAAASDPFPGTRNITSFIPVLHNGEVLDQPLLDITRDGENILFTFKSAGGDNFMFYPNNLPTIESTYIPETKTANTPGSRVRAIGSHLIPGDLIIEISGTGFRLSTDSVKWYTSINLTVKNDSTIDSHFFVRYSPGKQVCDVQQGRIVARLAGGTLGTYNISGTSPRPTLIHAPEVTKFREVSPTSFKAYWDPVEDADEYYVTLYHMEEGEESTVESFEGFDDELTVRESGWYTSFYRTTTKAKEADAVSAWFKLDGEEMMSPIYNLPVKHLKMWLNAPATSDTEVGWIFLKGICDTDGEVVLDTIKITKNTKKYWYERDLDLTKGFRRFILKYAAFGGEGVCLDAFTTTFNEKTVYTYRGRERTIQAREGADADKYTLIYVKDLTPDTEYYLRLQCSENKGCNEHLSDLCMPYYIHTLQGEPVGSQHLTLAYDSISYDPATHVICIPDNQGGGYLNLYSANGNLIKRIPVSLDTNIVPLPEADLRRNAVYFVKYLPGNKLSRKGGWIKIMFK